MRLLLRDLTPGTDYTLQLRQNDGTTVSEWSRVFDLTTMQDTLAPAHPTDVEWVVNRTAFSAKWDAVTQNADASPMDDFSHYIVRLTNSVDVAVEIKVTNNFYDLPFETNKALFGTPQADLTLSVFAVDLTGNRSVSSAEVNAVNPAPPEPEGVVAAGIVGGVNIAWDVQTIDDLEAYDIFLSVSDPDFTPGPSNQVWSGTSNAYFHESDSLGISHHFKIRSRDVFGSISDYVSVSATPTSPTDVDTEAPDVPTGLDVSMQIDSEDSAYASATFSWDAVVADDLAGYVVRYKASAGTDYNYINVPAGVESVIINGIPVGVQYDFSVQSYDIWTNRSGWASSIDDEATNTAPSTPAAADVVGNTQSVQVSHDVDKATSGRLESDVAFLEVHLGTTNVFTASDATIIGTMQVEPGSTFVSAVFPAPVTDSSVNRWVRVIAVDRGGLKSSASAVAAVTIGLVLNANIANATITSAKINDLDANKITAGSGIINDLLIKAALTIDTAGIVKSSNYSAGVAGWRLTNNSLEINQGTIKAAALQLQDSHNILHPAYADFEFVSTWYTGKMLTFNDGGTTTATISDSTDVAGRNSTQCLKHTWSGGGTFSRAYQAPNSSTYNVVCEPNTDYIFSGYFYNKTGSGAKTVGLAIKLADGTFLQPGGVSNSIAANNTWTRISGTFNTGNNTSFLTFVSLYTSGSVYVDNLQIERQLTAATTPSQWKPPSSTSIDGGIIRTGEIRSTALANGLGGQPAWSINITGAAQFGDATVRGRLVVGDPSNPSADGVNSRIHSANYVAGTSGWIIRNDGYAEFRQLAVNSIKVTAMDSPMQNNTYAKLFDYMQDGNLWTQSGSIIQKTDTGAYSAESLFEFTGPGHVIRNGTGVTKVAYDPTILYRVSARVRAYDVATINTNSGFETNTTGWTAYATTTIARDTTKFFSGVASLKLSQNGSNAGLYGAGTTVSVEPGKTYTFSSRILPNSTVIRDNIHMNISWLNVGGTQISATTNDFAPPVDGSGTPIPIDGTTWSQFNSTGVAPAGAVTAKFEVQLGIAATATAGTLAWIDDVFVTTAPRVNIGVFGFDNSNNIIDWDFVDAGTTPTKMHATPVNPADYATLADNQYMTIASNLEIPVTNATAGSTADWITVTGYLKGRGGTGTDGLFGTPTQRNDPYNPAPLNQSVRYIVPYVEFDVAAGSVAQLDQFSIEAFENGAPSKVSTTQVPGVVGQKGVSIENIADSIGFDHAIRFYTGAADEDRPGMIGHVMDGDYNNAAHIRMSPPQINATSNYDKVYVGVYDANPNFIYDGSFKKGIYNWNGNTATPGSALSWDETEGRIEPGSLKITTTGTPISTTEIYGGYNIFTSTWPELFGQQFRATGWFKSNVVGRTIQLVVRAYDETNATIWTYLLSSTSDTSWKRISWYLPVTVPDNTHYLHYYWFFTNASAGDTLWIDEAQLEIGAGVTDYRDAQVSTFKVNTDMIRSTGSMVIAKNDLLEFPTQIWGQGSNKRDRSYYPGYLVQSEFGISAFRNIGYADSGGTRTSTAITHFASDGSEELQWRMYGLEDDSWKGAFALFNKNDLYIMRSYAKTGEEMEDARNVSIGGHLDVVGEPDWINMTLTGGASTVAGANPPSYYKNNGMVFLRGLVGTVTKGVGNAIATLPVGYRPTGLAYMGSVSPNGANSSEPVTVCVNTSGQVFWFSSQSTIPAGTRSIALDSLHFSLPGAPAAPPGADTTAPSAPTSFSINAYSSGSTTGVYQLKWTNPSASDLAGVKILWRTDRYPTVTIPGSGTKTLTTDGEIITISGTPSQAKVYNHSGIPVNRTIYYRIVAFDKSGNHSTYASASRYLLASPLLVNATDSDAYRLQYGGMWRNDGDELYQGDWAGNDDHRGLFFYGTQIYTLLSTGGVVRVPTKMTVYMRRLSTAHGNNSGVPLNIRAHVYSAKPSGDPAGGITNEGALGDGVASLSRGEAVTLTIPSAWYNDFVNATSSARSKGVGVIGTTTGHYMAIYGKSAGAQHGKLTIYHKG